MGLEEVLELRSLFTRHFMKFYAAASHGPAVGVCLAAYFVEYPIVYFEVLHSLEGYFP